jgi:LPPG:FO 2-phospho-L-lactate transferase
VKVAVLSGGVGGARFVRGMVDAVEPSAVTVIGNVGDDLEVLGLHVSPDLDSILYALADLNDEERGWGRAGETWNALESVSDLGGEAWFKLGDRDLGLHLVRTAALREGEPLSSVTARLVEALGIEARLVPATDHPLRTFVETDAGELSFQDWFVRRGHRDEVDGVRFEGAETARPAPGVLDALTGADLLVIAPSNPFVSIGPVLAVREIREAFTNRRVPSVAVSPLIGGKAVKGPADRMLSRLAGGTDPVQVTQCYLGLVDALVIDEADAAGAAAVQELGVRPIVAKTLMSDAGARRRLAEAALEAAAALR